MGFGLELTSGFATKTKRGKAGVHRYTYRVKGFRG